MEEVVEEETQTVQSAAGLYTGCSTLMVTPDVLGLFSYIFLMISGLFFFRMVCGRRENTPLHNRKLLRRDWCGLDHSHCKPVK